MTRRYTVVLEWDPEGPGYGVIVPALPGCFTQGATVPEALERAREAIAGHVAALIDLGEPVPAEDTPALVTTVEVDDAVPIGV
jgi:antitoxin HicB